MKRALFFYILQSVLWIGSSIDVSYTTERDASVGLGADNLSDDEFCECGVSNRFGTRIVGGERAPIVKYPWFVGLKVFNYQSCGGVLINGCFIMTAAHCTKKLRSVHEISAVLGTENRYDLQAKKFKIVEVIRHPKYNPNQTHDDIALLRVDPPIRYSDRIRPICLPNDDKDDYLGKRVTVLGFGYTNERGIASNVMRDVELQVIKREHCIEVFKDEGTVYQTNLCAGGERGKDACLGDSGGPLIIQEDDGHYTLVGIVSWGVGCARPGIPGVYTQVNQHLDWIQSVVSETGCCVRETASEFATENEFDDEEGKRHHMWWDWFG